MDAGQLVDKSVNVLTATILSGATTSDAVNLSGCTVAIFQTPATITGTSVTFLGSIDKGSTFKEVRAIGGSAIAYTVAADGSYPLDKNLFAGYDQIKIVMATQGADRAILVKPFCM